MSFKNEFDELLTNTQRFLKQQQKLYGDTLFLQKFEEIQKEQSLVMTPSKETRIESEVDLFGNVITPDTRTEIKVIVLIRL